MMIIGGIVALFVFESAYISIFYDPNGTYTEAGLMLIFALEASFMFKVSTSNLDEKKAFGSISKTSRIYTAVLGGALLVLMAIGAGALGLQHYRFIWIALFALSACTKVAWILRRGKAAGANQT